MPKWAGPVLRWTGLVQVPADRPGQLRQLRDPVPGLGAELRKRELGVADAGPPPSCAPGGPGMTNCGPGGSGTESCCTSLEVTGGTYYRTYTNSSSGPALADPATVSEFR